ncbi:MAG: hypothetical protein JST68_17375 [Bacteroidetes bacterium]|nr:hypothetical protein [Bacteroidota bacterium]
MATFNSFMRSTNAALNRMERAHNRRVHREAQIEKARQKEEVLANAALSVQRYNELIELLTNTHKEEVESMDWQSLYEEPAPSSPVPSHALEQKAALRLSRYRPSFFDNLFKIVAKRIKKLENKVIKAREEDAALFTKAESAYQKAIAEWEFLHNMADGVLRQNIMAYKDAVAHFNPFSEMAALGLSIYFIFHSDHVVAELEIQSDDILPREILSLTSTGKLSRKNMPTSRFNELYQDHACSSVLRVGREVLALLPVDFVIVNAVADLLNSATGRVESQTVVSVIILPDTLDRLQFDRLNPSDSMQNFVHRMQFSKAGGLSPVKPLTVDDLAGYISADSPIITRTSVPSTPASSQEALDKRIIEVYHEKGVLFAVKYYKDHTNCELLAATEYVEKLVESAK